jgi:hypothetical protein
MEEEVPTIYIRAAHTLVLLPGSSFNVTITLMVSKEWIGLQLAVIFLLKDKTHCHQAPAQSNKAPLNERGHKIS